MKNAQFVLEDLIKSAQNATFHIFSINLFVCNLVNRELMQIILLTNVLVKNLN